MSRIIKIAGGFFTRNSKLLFWALSLGLFRCSLGFCQLLWGNGLGVCTYSGNQWRPTAALDNDGGIIVAWSDYRAGFGSCSVYAQRVLPSGQLIWIYGGLEVTLSSGYQDNPLAIEGGIVAYSDRPYLELNLKAQKFSASGDRLWGTSGATISNAIRDQTNLCGISDFEGGAFFAYVDWSLTTLHSNIFAQHLDSTGSTLWGSGVVVCDTIGNQFSPQITISGDGIFLTWIDYRTGSSRIYAQKLDWNGNPIFAEDGIPVFVSTGDQGSPRIASDSAGGVYIAAVDYRNGFAQRAIYLQHLDATGAILWDLGGIRATLSPYPQENVHLTSGNFGNAIVGWFEYQGVSPFIRMQKCDFFGNRLWTDDGILAVDLDYAQDDFELVPCAFGGANLLWMQGYQMVHDVYSQWISPNGVLAWGDSGLALPQWEYEQLYPVGFFYDNKLFAFWQDQRDGGWNIYGQSVAFQAPPMRISDLQITLLGDSLSISWNPVELDSLGQPMTAEYYNIYQGVDPYFDISSLIPVAQTIDTIWFDVNLVHQDQKYYIVTAVIDSLEEGEK